MAIYIQVDISSDVETIRDNFKSYILDRTDNFEEDLVSIREGNPVKNLGNLNLDDRDEGVVYRNFIYFLFGCESKLDYRVCDAAIKYCFTDDPLFQKFIKAVIKGVDKCDGEKLHRRYKGEKFLDPKHDSINHGMYNQAKVFLDHFAISSSKLGYLD